MRKAEDRLKFIKPQDPVLVETPPVSDTGCTKSSTTAFARRSSLTGPVPGPSPAPASIGRNATGLLSPLPKAQGEVLYPRRRDDWPTELSCHALAHGLECRTARLRRHRHLHLDGRDLRALPTIERKAMLWDLVKPAKGIIQYSQHVEGGGAAFYEAAEKMGLEGMVSKRRGSPYRSGAKDEAWLKIKCWDIGDFELVGIKQESGKETKAIMARDGRYAGSIVALSKGLRERLWQRVPAGKPPAGLPKVVAADQVEWVKPGIIGKVRFSARRTQVASCLPAGFQGGRTNESLDRVKTGGQYSMVSPDQIRAARATLLTSRLQRKLSRRPSQATRPSSLPPRKNGLTTPTIIAMFLGKANPNWSEKDMQDMLHKHLELTTGEVVGRLKKDWAADIKSYDEGHVHMLKFADMLTEGIAKQFPDKLKA